MPEGERLQKVLARVGIGSRRVCEDFIAAGRVTVNGEVAVLGRRVDVESDAVEIDGAPIGIRPGLIYLLLNKPKRILPTKYGMAHIILDLGLMKIKLYQRLNQ